MNTADDLKNLGLKVTVPRLKILEVFNSAESGHLTAEDLYRALIEAKCEIGLATVYRALTQFEEAGLIAKHHFESGKAVYELKASSHHDHLVCLDCGRVEEFYEEEIERRQKKIARERGFSLQEHALNLYVECTKPDCRHRAAANQERGEK